MEDDERSVIDQIQSRSVGYTGKELSADEMATEFAKWDIQTRVNTLEEIKADNRDLNGNARCAQARATDRPADCRASQA